MLQSRAADFGSIRLRPPKTAFANRLTKKTKIGLFFRSLREPTAEHVNAHGRWAESLSKVASRLAAVEGSILFGFFKESKEKVKSILRGLGSGNNNGTYQKTKL